MGSNINFASNLFFGDNLGLNVSGIRVVDPRLEMDASGIQRPSPQSPAVDAALATSSTIFDMDGEPRQSPQDIGADELIPGQSPRGPVSLCQVGPKTYRIGIPSACETVVADAIKPLPPSSLVAQ